MHGKEEVLLMEFAFPNPSIACWNKKFHSNITITIQFVIEGAVKRWCYSRIYA